MKTNKLSVKRITNHVDKISWSILDSLIPPRCVTCGELNNDICPECMSKFKSVPEPICNRCGDHLAIAGKCENCKRNKPAYTQVKGVYLYTDVLRDAIRSYKFNRNLGLARSFASILTSSLEKICWDVDIIVPTPVSSTRLKERGFHHTKPLVKYVSQYSGIEVDYFSLSKLGDGTPQVGLSYDQRWKNVINKFVVKGPALMNKRVLIIDDIVTSGATMSGCADAIIKAGAREVYGLALARTVILKDIES